jgi:hypothetical protein
MTATEVLAECRRLGLLLTADGDRLRVRGHGRLDDALRAGLAANKAELLTAVADVCGGCAQGMTPALVVGCGWPGCRREGK